MLCRLAGLEGAGSGRPDGDRDFQRLPPVGVRLPTNDEAYQHDPRGDDDHPGYGFYEVLNSTWPARLAEHNEHAFPGRSWPWGPGRHFFLGFHDGSGQFLARNMTVEVFDADFDAVLKEAVGRGFGL